MNVSTQTRGPSDVSLVRLVRGPANKSDLDHTRNRLLGTTDVRTALRLPMGGLPLRLRGFSEWAPVDL